MNYDALGRRIRFRRHEQGMTQEALAEAAGISSSFLGHIERGSRKASLETILAIAHALEIGLDSLLIDSLPPLPLRVSKKMQNIIADLAQIGTEIERLSP